MKITELNYKCFEGKIIKMAPSGAKVRFLNIEKAVIEEDMGLKWAKMTGTILINDNGVIFSTYTSKWILLNDGSYSFHSKEEVSSYIDSVIAKKKEGFFSNKERL